MPGRLSRRGFLIGTSGVAFTLAAAACGGDDGGSGSTSGPTVRDEFGATVVPADPRRVVSVGHNDHDTLLALGVVPVGVFDWYGDQPDATWPWAHDLLDGSTPAIVGTAGSGIDTEAVASVDPDLIIGTYSGVTQSEHDKLSAIAPTVADANPVFRGRTVIVGALKGAGQFGVFGPEDPKVRFFTELGFVNPPVTQQITGNFAEISTEQLSLANVDLLVWYAGGGYGDKLRAELDNTPIYQELDVVKAGRTITLEDAAAEAMAWSTVLSLPYALTEIPPRVAPLLA